MKCSVNFFLKKGKSTLESTTDIVGNLSKKGQNRTRGEQIYQSHKQLWKIIFVLL